MSLLVEFKRRNVFRVAAAYLVSAWLLIEIGRLMFDAFAFPDWASQLLIALLVLGSAPAIALAWILHKTPEGTRRETEPGAGQARPPSPRRFDQVIIGAVVALAFLTFYRMLLGPVSDAPHRTNPAPAVGPARQAEPAAAPPNSIAVLPFANMSADPDSAYFSDGVSEEILNVLARVPGLRVAARSSAFAYKGTKLNVTEIGRSLRVAHVLEGSVRRQEKRVRVTAQLVQTDTGLHVWAETFERTSDDIFAIPDEIAGAIAEALQIELGLAGGSNRTGTENLQAYEFYLRGVYHWNLRTYDDLVSAVDFFQKAVGADPDFAKAHARLAMTYAVIGGYGNFPGDPSVRARASAERALALDPRSVEATAALAMSRVGAERDIDGAVALLRQAVAINPNFATGHQWLGNALALSGQLGAALASLDRAVALDPAARIMGVNRAAVLYLLGRLEDSLAESERVLAFAPNHAGALMQAADVSLALGDRDRHRDFMLRLGRRKGDAGVALIERLIEAYDDRLLQELMIDELERTPIHAAQNPFDPSPFRGPDIPVLLLRLGGRANAVAYLRHLHRQGRQDLGFWLILPELAALRCEPVIRSMIEDLAVTPYWDDSRCEASGQ